AHVRRRRRGLLDRGAPPVHRAAARVGGQVPGRAGQCARRRLRPGPQRRGDRRRLAADQPPGHAGAGLPGDRAVAGAGEVAVRVPAGGVPLRCTAARGDRVRLGPDADAAGQTGHDPRRDRVPQGGIRARPADRGSHAHHPRSAQGSGHRRDRAAREAGLTSASSNAVAPAVSTGRYARHVARTAGDGQAESLFDAAAREAEDAAAPLAVRMRPRTLDEVVGQRHLTGPGAPFRKLIDHDAAMSVVLWGPPGTGKTTLAHVVSEVTRRRFTELSAVTAGVKDVRAAIDTARRDLGLTGTQTVLFIDEVHRFNKAQQDALLPAVENRWVSFIGATTENPFFTVVGPLLSRSLLLTLEPLGDADVRAVITRALADERGL